jgi:hypothetical protein
LLERAARASGAGRVLLFTTPFDDRRDRTGRPPNDYLQNSSFYFVLLNKALGYLAGDDERSTLNHAVGQSVAVPLPPAPRFPTYTLEGPGIAASDATLTPAAGQAELRLTPAQTAQPGHFAVTGGERQWAARFSLNVPGGEFHLTRVPPEPLEAVLGRGSVLPAGTNKSVRELVRGRFTQPLELFPFLMIGLLVLLAVENLLANKFYGQAAPVPSPVGREKA